MANTTKNSIYLTEKFQKYFEELAEDTGLGKSGVITMVLGHYKEYQDNLKAMSNLSKLESITKRIEELENK